MQFKFLNLKITCSPVDAAVLIKSGDKKFPISMSTTKIEAIKEHNRNNIEQISLELQVAKLNKMPLEKHKEVIAEVEKQLFSVFDRQEALYKMHKLKTEYLMRKNSFRIISRFK